MNILITVPGIQRNQGGPSVSVTRLCESLGSLGAQVHLLTLTDRKHESDCILTDPHLLKTHLIRSSFSFGRHILSMPNFFLSIAELIQKNKIQIIHDNGLWLPSNYLSAQCAKLFGIPYVVHTRGMLEPWAMSYRVWKKQLAWQFYQKQNLKTAGLLIATSQQEASSIRKTGVRRPIAVIPNGVDIPPIISIFNPEKKKRTALFLSRLHPVKGILNLLAAWAIVKPKDWQLIIAGPDENGYREEVENAINNFRLKNNVQLVGPVVADAKENIYRQADLFILPSFSENFGIVVVEALAYGVPVITTKGAPWESLIKNRCGWWIDIGVEPLVDAIRDATRLSDTERLRLGQNGRRYVEHNFSWGLIAKQTIVEYEMVLSRRNMPLV